MGPPPDAATSKAPLHPTIVKKKLCLVGEEGVGKTSLIRRFVTGMFDDAYVRTLGAVATKRTIDLADSPLGPVQVDLVILDITGKRTFLDLFQEAYFKGAAGVLGVFDLTHRRSLDDLAPWIDGVREEVGRVPVVALGNKADLREKVEVHEREIGTVLGSRDVRTMKSSAKTGENVDDAFLGLTREMLAAR
ncbi:MAG: GTP-binding protein [Methanobacteriota archaeon]|nr:MAG: GTP-binding protein [Euryarchaeota archaeon]